jgi:hypothetical protein
MEPEGSFLRSLEPATRSQPDQDEYSTQSHRPVRQILVSPSHVSIGQERGLLPSNFPTTIFY